ncbi:Longitudinals lacking protein, isoforms A/B/D/L [Harpegnathos saltator]|uniref:Longitudinals lacking protein, isoforms A/B/D/L n=1 Tax=Harpegnathos saltator TaxID=610380 RepID=E2BJC5_HARSA|nr:Longitudinals lacking protein, isoforms A/B/D/L [Harpegnathos saltator]
MKLHLELLAGRANPSLTYQYAHQQNPNYGKEDVKSDLSKDNAKPNHGEVNADHGKDNAKAFLERKYNCENCDKSYKTRASLSYHRRVECEKEPQFVCLSCPYKSKRRTDLRRHMLLHCYRSRAIKRENRLTRASMKEFVLPVQVEVHVPDRKPLLPFAGLKIPNASDYVGMRLRGQFICDRCGRSYMRKDSLQRHMQWECGKEPQFQCPQCPQRCKRKAHWLRHIRRQHPYFYTTLDICRPKIEID